MSVDPDLLALFAGEASEALDRLSQEVMALEQTADPARRAERVATMFRAAHSLKGSARLVGLDGVGDVAHALEDVLGELRAGTLQVDTALATLVLRGVDLLTGLLPDALAGVDQTSSAAVAVAEIVGSARALHRSADVPAGDPVSAPDIPEPAPSAPTITDTVRLPAAQVEAIGRLVGESLAAHAGLERLLAATDDERVAASLHQLRRVLQSLEEEARRARMVRFGSVAGPLQRAARDVATHTGKAIEWEIEGSDTQLDRQVLEQLRDPLLHLVRNAVDHGLESPDERAAVGKPAAGTIRVDARTRGDEVTVTVSDDGRGVDHVAVAGAARQLGVEVDPERAIFTPGVSTSAVVTDVSGRGVGLDVVQDAVTQLRGEVSVRSRPGAGASFQLTVPLSVASLRCLVVRAGGERYGLPLAACTTIVDDLDERLHRVEGGTAIELEGVLHSLHDLGRMLHPGAPSAAGPVVRRSVGGRAYAMRVDGLDGQRDVVVKDLPSLAAALGAVSGASVEPDGTVMLVLDASGLVELADRPAASAPQPRDAIVPHPRTGVESGRRREVLVVDDALTVRELQRSILGRAGYAVRTAVDGQDAVSQLSRGRPDLVISDVEMPRMDGFTLTGAIRAHPTLQSLPVILVTSLDDEDHRRRGLEAGADAYLAKDGFDERALLAAIDQVLGAAA